MFIFFAFLVGLFSQALVSNGVNEINLIPLKIFYETYIEVFKNNNFAYFLISFLGNIIMFIPIGFFIPLLINISNKKVILIGFSISFLIEIIQLFLERGTDIDDLILNTFGVFIGLLIYKTLLKRKNKFILKFR